MTGSSWLLPGLSLLAAAACALGARAARGPGGFSPEQWDLTSGEVKEYASRAVLEEPGGAPVPEAGSDSPVFRMRSVESGYGDVEVSLDVLNLGLAKGSEANAWDGLHIWLRYQDPTLLYAVSFNRRDDRVVIKKKTTGGDSYGGTYAELCAPVPYEVPYGRWQSVVASAAGNPDGSVTLALTVDGRLLLKAVDAGAVGGPPIRKPGRVGLRADNADFRFRDLKVRRL